MERLIVLVVCSLLCIVSVKSWPGKISAEGGEVLWNVHIYVGLVHLEVKSLNFDIFWGFLRNEKVLGYDYFCG